MPQIYKPHAYQAQAIDFMLANKRCALFLEMGLGKTSITLSALQQLRADKQVHKVLVVAPLRVVKNVWEQESTKWQHTMQFRFAKVIGSVAAREKALAANADIFMINYESLPWLLTKKEFDFDTVIFDEASKMKNPKAKRFKIMKKCIHDVDRVVLLTGSPAAKSLLDVWSLSYLVDQGQRLGRTFSAYRNQYFMSDRMGYHWEPRYKAEERIYHKLKDISLSLSANDYLYLPKKINNVVTIRLNRSMQNQYAAFARNFITQLTDGHITAANAGVLTNKLLQFCNGALYTDEQGNWQEIHQYKLEALNEIVEEAMGHSVLVAYQFQSDRVRLKKHFPHAGLATDDDAIIAWNAGKLPMLLVQPSSAGHGLNLQAGGHIIVWFGLTWSLEQYEQLNARLHRQGQTQPVMIHHLVVEGTIDEIVLSQLGNKSITQNKLLEALKNGVQY